MHALHELLAVDEGERPARRARLVGIEGEQDDVGVLGLVAWKGAKSPSSA